MFLSFRLYVAAIFVFVTAICSGTVFPSASLASSTVEILADMSMTDLMDMKVSSAGFFDMPVDESPGTIWVISENDMATVPATNLADLLQLTVPGAQVSNHSIYGTIYALRGMVLYDNSTTQFMWDGMNLNSAGSLGVNSGLKSPLIGDIAKIEVGHGPCAIIYGNSAINGFINQVPKTGATHTGITVDTVYGTEDQMMKIESGFGHVYGVNKDLYLYAGIAGNDGIQPPTDLGFSEYGYGDSLPGNYPVQHNEWPQYRMSANWHHHDFRFVGFVNREYYSLDTYYGSADYLKSPDRYQQSVALRPGLLLDIGVHETLDITIPVVLSDSGYLSTRLDSGDDGNPDTAVIRDRGNSNIRAETKWVLRSTRFKNQQWAAGFTVGYQLYRANRYYFSSPPNSGLMIGNDTDWMEYSAFTENTFRLSPAWTVTAGIRFDAIRYREEAIKDYVKDSEVWSPRLATAVRVADNTVVKLGYQEGFHYPPATEIWGGDYKPETIKSIELNLIQGLPAMGLNLTLTSFYNIYQDFMLSRFGGLSGNLEDEFGAVGGEFVIDWTDGNTLHAQLSYAYSQPVDLAKGELRVDTTSKDMSMWLGYPAHSVKGRVSQFWFDKKLMTSLAMEYGSAVPVAEENYYGGRVLYDNDRFTISAKGEYWFTDHLSMNMTIKNLGHNNVPVPSYPYQNPWEGDLGEDNTLVYLGLRWK